jgi:glycosyltransferase involved in cell wall biosynthesis
MENKTKEFKFSIVVPCYNEANAVAQTVEEISQTLKDWNNEKDTKLSYEMIFINDGSKDETST